MNTPSKPPPSKLTPSKLRLAPSPLNPIWSPSLTRVANANMTRFLTALTTSNHIPKADYALAYDFSIAEPDLFWSVLWDFLEIRGEKGNSPFCKFSNDFKNTRWFSTAKLNFATNLLWCSEDKSALKFYGESQTTRALSYKELGDLVNRMAEFLTRKSVQPQDRVAALVPNMPETVAAMLGCAAIGAGWCSVAPEFGPTGILERFRQIEPTVLFTSDHYFYKGKRVEILPKVEQILTELPSVHSVVVLPYDRSLEENTLPNDSWYHLSDILQTPPRNTPFENFPFSHPLYYLFTSGTTGKPKGIIHSAGGTLLEHKKELELHTDLKKEDTIFYQTTCAWMMWNWLVSGLATGSTVVLYDGFPLLNDGRKLLEIAEREAITIFGTNPGFLREVANAGVLPKKELSLKAMRTILSTGAPLLPSQFEFVYKNFPADICLSSISGGTDIIGCFALGNPILPVYSGELQCRSLGYRVEAFDDAGHAVTDTPGELVCSAPFPSMPIGFVNDESQMRYQHAYFEKFPNVWHHGDKITITNRGTVIVHDRSDDILNAEGVRIGPAEIYRQIFHFAEVRDALAVTHTTEDHSKIVLFIVMNDGAILTEELEKSIRQRLRDQESPRHVPWQIIAVPAFPKTLSGKTSASAVRSAIHGTQIENSNALANPEILKAFRLKFD
ncbi:MAG: acetoacetate--CoA ligase [Bdellovibrionales bacterium]|nr:acetoacetate--CoA ligase [Bdellovibrionales bacterium]